MEMEAASLPRIERSQLCVEELHQPRLAGEKRSIFQRLGRRQTGEDDGMGEPLSAAEAGK